MRVMSYTKGVAQKGTEREGRKKKGVDNSSLTKRACVLSGAHALFMLFVFAGCVDFSATYEAPEPRLVQFSTDSLTTYELEGEVLTSSDSLGRPILIAVGQDQILVGDTKSPRSLLVFDRETGEFITSVAERGEGPSEISYLWAMDFKPGSSAGWLFDYSPRTMHFFDGDSLTGQTVRLKGGGTPMFPVWIAEDSIAATGLYSFGRIAVYAPSGDFVRVMGMEPPGDPTVAVEVRQHAYEAALKTNSDGTKIVAASENTDRLEIYDTSGLLHLIRGPRFHEPEYSINGNDEGDSWLSIQGENRQGYVDAAVTDELIFALYSGRTRGWIRSQGWFAPPAWTVIVFTWEGDPIAVLNIEDGALAIGLTQDGRNLYALYHRPVPMILRYAVPELL